jgi:UPF0716 family protein affecting phage T7 exclusion
MNMTSFIFKQGHAMRLLLFLLFPFVELYLLVKVGGEIGALNMVIWVFVSALVGLWAVRAQGRDAMLKARADIAAGRVPRQSFVEGLLLFFGGVLLILPGLLTDAVGLFLLIPPCRRWATVFLVRYLTSHQAQSGAGFSRVIFFRSTGFDPARGPQEPFGRHSPEAQDSGPRQATVIDSTAIDVTSENAPADKSQNEPAAKE